MFNGKSVDMSEHNDYCRKEGDLATLKTQMSDITKIVKGNGQPGLEKQVTQLNIIIPELQESIEDLSNNVRRLLDRGIVSDTERALKMSAKQKLTAIITGIFGGATVIIMVVDMILNKG